MWQTSVFSRNVNLEKYEIEDMKWERNFASVTERAPQGWNWELEIDPRLLTILLFAVEGSLDALEPTLTLAVHKKLAIKKIWNQTSADNIYIGLSYDIIFKEFGFIQNMVEIR